MGCIRAKIAGGEGFVCGSEELLVAFKPCSWCDCFHDFLCDYPMGRGKTCDTLLCEKHARAIGEDKHLCPIHFAEFQKKAGVDRINPWPPKREAEGSGDG